jgi:hypothetical protein
MDSQYGQYHAPYRQGASGYQNPAASAPASVQTATTSTSTAPHPKAAGMRFITPKPGDNPRLTTVVRWILLIALFGGLGAIVVFYCVMSGLVRDVKFIKEMPLKFAVETFVISIGTTLAFTILFYTRNMALTYLPHFAGLLFLKLFVFHVLLELSGTYTVLGVHDHPSK